MDIKSALTKKEEREEQNDKRAIKSPHDLDKQEDQYSMNANKSSEKKSMKRLLDETQVDESIEKSESTAVDQGDEIPLEPEFQSDQEHDPDKLIKDLASKVKLTDSERTKFDIKQEAPKKKKQSCDDAPEEDDYLELGMGLETQAESQSTSMMQAALQAMSQAKL